MFNDDLCLGHFCFFLSLTLMALSSYHGTRTNKKTLLLLRSMAAGVGWSRKWLFLLTRSS
jgi:hypothetical protein